MENLIATSDLIKWCDDLVKQGRRLSMGWEGGGDSGWAWFEIDGQRVTDDNNAYTNQLVDLLYDQLDYGSWAGEFNAQGEAVYSAEEKAFVGVDNYSEDENEDFPCQIVIRIPKDLWFDQLEIALEDEDKNVAFHIRNGFLTEQHDLFLERLIQDVEAQVNLVIDEFNNQNDNFNHVWDQISIERSEFEQEGDFLIHTIKTLNINYSNREEKEIYLQLLTEDDE